MIYYPYCPSRVSQRFALSPTLFNIHIDDLDTFVPEHLKVSTHKYADYCTQSEHVALGKCSKMQEVMDSVKNWSDDNKMELKAKERRICEFDLRSPFHNPPIFLLNEYTLSTYSGLAVGAI